MIDYNLLVVNLPLNTKCIKIKQTFILTGYYSYYITKIIIYTTEKIDRRSDKNALICIVGLHDMLNNIYSSTTNYVATPSYNILNLMRSSI